MRNKFTLRVIAPIALVSLLLLGLALCIPVYLLQLEKKTAQLLSENIASVRAGEELEIGLREIRNNLYLFVITGDRGHLDAVPGLKKSTDRWLGEAGRLAMAPREQALIGQVKRGYARFFEGFDHIALQRSPELGREVFELADSLLTHEILGPAHQYLDVNEEMVQASHEEQRVLTRRLTFGVLLLGVGGAAGGLTAGFLLARRMSRSIIQLRLPIRDAAGKLNQVVGPVQIDAGDSLEQVEAAMQQIASQVSAAVSRLQETGREAMRAEQLASVGHLAASVAHELRNPLTSIKMLLEGNREEAAARGMPLEDLDIIEHEIGRLEQRLQQFLDLARPPRLERRPTDLCALIRETLGLVRGRLVQQKVRLEVTAVSSRVMMEADGEQIRQILVNLALNALDMMPAGGRLEILLRLPDDGFAEVFVQDTGPGIAPSVLPRLFEPFLSGKKKGLGLGLAVSRRIAESHGGTLTGANRPEGGACFVLRLPASIQDCPAVLAGKEISALCERQELVAPL